ncbi:MAG: MoaD/ThiS family protein [Acidobacteria bacterium]|nr:MoaD/ThiS family protein [Acidobacteriota bacterium]
MQITTLFFGATADAAGTREAKIAINDGTTVRELIEKLRTDYTGLATHKLLFALNEEYAETDTIIKDGDEVAIFTAVSGG